MPTRPESPNLSVTRSVHSSWPGSLAQPTAPRPEPARRQVHLVRLVEQLRRARRLRLRQRFDADADVEAAQPVVDRAERALQVAALALGRVHRAARAVLAADRGRVEAAQRASACVYSVLSAGHSGTSTSGSASRTRSRSTGLSSMNTTDCRPRFSSSTSSAMFCALSLQLMRQPARSSGADDHLRVPGDRLERDRLLVLADDGQRDPAPRQRLQRALEFRRYASPTGRGRRACRFSQPTSPTMPPHIVSSRSTIDQLARLARDAAQRGLDVARRLARARALPNGTLAMNHSRALYAALPALASSAARRARSRCARPRGLHRAASSCARARRPRRRRA